jgi:hypothetical protein
MSVQNPDHQAVPRPPSSVQSDLAATHQSLVVGRRMMEILVDGYRNRESDVAIADLDHALTIAFPSQGQCSHLEAANAAKFLALNHSGENDREDSRAFQGLMYELAAERSLKGGAGEETCQEYLAQAEKGRGSSDASRPY